MNIADNAILLAVKNLPGGVYGAYTALKGVFPSTPFFSVCYKLLSPKSKEKLKTAVKGDALLGKFYTKYLILTLLLESETMSIQGVLSKYGDTAKKYLSMIGIDASPGTLQSNLDKNVDKIIELIKTYKDPNELFKHVPLPSMPSIPFMGGKRTKRIKKRKTRRKGGTLNFFSQMKNKMNFKLWNLKNREEYKNLDENLYYPNPANRFSLSGQDPKNLSLLGETPKPISWKKRVAKHCLRVGYDDREKCINDNCSPYSMNDPSCNRVIDAKVLN